MASKQHGDLITCRACDTEFKLNRYKDGGNKCPNCPCVYSSYDGGMWIDPMPGAIHTVHELNSMINLAQKDLEAAERKIQDAIEWRNRQQERVKEWCDRLRDVTHLPYRTHWVTKDNVHALDVQPGDRFVFWHNASVCDRKHEGEIIADEGGQTACANWPSANWFRLTKRGLIELVEHTS